MAPELFLEAGLVVAERAARALADRPVLERIVSRAVAHVVALRSGFQRTTDA